ncbi:MAG: ATPase, partial [Bacilli bacterium]|nr:ATPase [Bacilli bacterium]
MFENKSALSTLEELGVSEESGLSPSEVEQRRAKYGPNKLQEKPRDPWYKIFWGNIADPMTLILAITAVISLVLAIYPVFDPEGLADVFIIFGVVLINAIIGTVQEMRAEKALEALKQMS